MRDTVVVDLDGTLSDARARRHFVTGKRRDYEAFHARLGDDPVFEWCRTLMTGMGAICIHVVIVTARNEGCELATRDWLARNEVHFNELHLVRPDGDTTPDHELKRRWLRAYGPERILFAVEDRTRVADMFREEGVPCLQCANYEKDVTSKEHV